jgi:serine/threonine protein kinase
MSTQRWDRIKQVLEEALRFPPERRKSYLDMACGPDRELRAEVESLISSHEAAGSQFLAATAPELLLTAAGTAALPVNKVIANYRLVEELGSGGMGQVWLAEQTAPVKRQVALKLLKGGMFDSAALQRFQSERQSLAMMDHPAIAKVFDAGATPDGQPYFVMEYVPGLPITDYCDQKRLTIPQRLELFIKVCEGVQHAHQKAVIHRDLKPANILVVEVDGKPLPRIIDFGLAKGFTPEVQGEARLTLAGGFLGTPGYMSPEQADPDTQDIDTRTDVYSLGAVLYVLLTGLLPFETGQPRRRPLDEALRELREEDPPRPSTKASMEKDSTKASAEARGMAPKQLASLLRGDLDWITLKALERDRRRRYATPTEFAADIRRYLKNEPVQAHPASVWYRGRKFARRYWVPVTAAAIVIASLSAGLYAANRQRLIAERRFAQLRKLSHDVVFDLDAELRGLPGAINARSKLSAMSTQYLAGLSADAANDKELALEVAVGYLQVARIQGVPAWNNLGQYREAEESLSKADKLLDSVLAADPRNRNALWLSANIAHDHASVAYGAGWPAQTMIASAAKARERIDRLVALGNLNRKEITDATYIYGDLAEHSILLHRFEEAAGYARLGIEVSRTNSTINGPRAQVFSQLAGALMDSGDAENALAAIQDARKELENLRQYRQSQNLYQYGDIAYDRTLLALVRAQEGQILGEDGAVNLNRPLEAAARFREGFDPLEDLASREPRDYHIRYYLAQVGHHLGDILRQTDPKQALHVYDQSLLRIREVPTDVAARRLEALLLAGSSYPARRTHREGDARARIDSAFRLLRETKDFPSETVKPGSVADTAVRALADHYAETGQPIKAIDLYEELRGKIMASNPDLQNDLLDAAYISRLDASLAALLHRAGRTDEAIALDGNRLLLWRHWDSKLHGNPFVQRQLATTSGF